MKFFSRKNKNTISKGVSTVEVLVAAAIISIAVLSATAVAQKSIAIARQSLHSSQAAFILEEGAEAVRILRDNGWANISGLASATDYYLVFSGGTWTSTTTANTVGIFTRSFTVTGVNRDITTSDIVTSGGVDDPGTKLITLTVTWEEGSNTVTKTLSFYITDLFS